MTVNVYSSDDVGAPALTGEVGSLTAVLDACLVTGYGAKAAAGWSKPFVGTNIAVFRQGAGSQSYFQIKDDGVDGTNGAKSGQVYVFDTMSDATTGTNKTPSTYTTSHYHQIPKSTTLDSTSRGWKIYASNKACYVLTKTGISTADAYQVSFFGDYNMINPAYGKAAIICAGNSSAPVGNALDNMSIFAPVGVGGLAATAHLLHDGASPSKNGGLWCDNANASGSIGAYRNLSLIHI